MTWRLIENYLLSDRAKDKYPPDDEKRIMEVSENLDQNKVENVGEENTICQIIVVVKYFCVI
jgi:hypothetical protein